MPGTNMVDQSIFSIDEHGKAIFLKSQIDFVISEMARKQGHLNLSACHLAVSQSWASYHTSSERGDSGLSADVIFFEFFQANRYYLSMF